MLLLLISQWTRFNCFRRHSKFVNEFGLSSLLLNEYQHSCLILLLLPTQFKFTHSHSHGGHHQVTTASQFGSERNLQKKIIKSRGKCNKTHFIDTTLWLLLLRGCYFIPDDMLGNSQTNNLVSRTGQDLHVYLSSPSFLRGTLQRDNFNENLPARNPKERGQDERSSSIYITSPTWRIKTGRRQIEKGKRTDKQPTFFVSFLPCSLIVLIFVFIFICLSRLAR